MRAFVFTDASLARYAGRFVWLSIDTENVANAPFLLKYPIIGTPKFFVINPKDESVVLSYNGGVTVPQLKQLLDDGSALVRGSRVPADAIIERADDLMLHGKWPEAVEAYEEAIAKASPAWPRLGRAAESLVKALRNKRDNAGCAARAHDLYPRLAGTVSGASLAADGLGCAARLNDPKLIDEFTKAVRSELENPGNTLSPIDRADLYSTLIAVRRRLKDQAGERAVREEALAFAEKEYANARTPRQRAVFNYFRAGMYLGLDQGEKAIALLEQAERELPNDYIPPLELSRAYTRLKRYDEAIEASDRALELVGKTMGRPMVLDMRADIFDAKGDKATAQQLVREAIAFNEALPPGARDESLTAFLSKKLPK